MKRKSLQAIIIFSFFLAACSAPAETQVAKISPDPTQNPTYSPTVTAEKPTETPNNTMLSKKMVNESSPLCSLEEAGSQFILSCADNMIVIKQGENRRGMDIILIREIDVDTFGFTLKANITSEPADPSRLDKNQSGFYFETDEGRRFALRIEGQYFNFEEWTNVNGKERTIALNQSYAPTLFSAGRVNSVQLTCIPDNCDLFANGTLVGRLPLEQFNSISTIGLFAASPWDERFGTVTIADLTIEDLAATRPETQPFMLVDDLTADNGIFSQLGLSGAFSDFEQDGFHFSPVIPYGYYSAKTGPALRNVSVRASVEMDFSPGVPATQYGGVICRASNEGMVAAVLRANATYTIYRDALRRKFAVLATNTVDNIAEGRSAHLIRLDCVDDTISFFIDGERVESFTDDRYGIQYGRSGFFTKAGGVAYSDAIIFSDLEIREIR